MRVRRKDVCEGSYPGERVSATDARRRTTCARCTSEALIGRVGGVASAVVEVRDGGEEIQVETARVDPVEVIGCIATGVNLGCH